MLRGGTKYGRWCLFLFGTEQTPKRRSESPQSQRCRVSGPRVAPHFTNMKLARPKRGSDKNILIMMDKLLQQQEKKNPSPSANFVRSESFSVFHKLMRLV